MSNSYKALEGYDRIMKFVDIDEAHVNLYEQGNMENRRGRAKMIKNGVAVQMMCPDEKYENVFGILVDRGAYYCLDEKRDFNVYYMNPGNMAFLVHYEVGEMAGKKYYMFDIFRCDSDSGKYINIFNCTRKYGDKRFAEDKQAFIDEINRLTEECDLQMLS